MIEEIKEKIKEILNNKRFPSNEYQLVYFLVLYRKFVECEKNLSTQEYIKIIKFYADWVLHSQLERGLTKKILKKVSDEIKNSKYFGLTNNGSDLLTFGSLINSLSQFTKLLQSRNPFNKRNSIVRFTNILRKEIINSPLVLYVNEKDKTKGVLSYFKFTNLNVDNVRFYYLPKPNTPIISGTLLFDEK